MQGFNKPVCTFLIEAIVSRYRDMQLYLSGGQLLQKRSPVDACQGIVQPDVGNQCVLLSDTKSIVLSCLKI
jgi:hypothetical protein